MEKNAILAIVLSVVVLLIWQQLFVAPRQKELLEEQERIRQEEIAQQQEQGAEGSGVSPEPPTQVIAPGADVLPSYDASQRKLDPNAPRVIVDTPLYDITFTTQGARIFAWQLDAHKNIHAEAVDLISDDARRLGALPLEIFTGDSIFDDELNQGRYTASINSVTLNEGDDSQTVRFTYTTSTGVRFHKHITFNPDSYDIQVAFEFEQPTQVGNVLSVAWGPGLGADLGAVARFEPEFVSKTSDKAKPTRNPLRKFEARMTYSNVTWSAINRKYFTAAFFPESTINTLSLNTMPVPPVEGEEKVDPIRTAIMGISQPLQDGQCQLSLYAGPKEYAKLTEAFPGFESLMDYGMFWFIAKPLAAFMAFLYGYVHNYGLVIICLTICIKIIFYPLTHKSYKSMQRMQEIQPKMKAIQDKHKNDKQKQQQAVMELYKQEGVNPMGGCFPMLLQIPVFFALYQTLLQSIELRGATFLWISDLSAPEPAFLNFLKPLVLLMGASMFLQQSMTPTTTDNKQAQMFKFMPILFTAMFWNFPSGLVLYWFMNNILTIGQQYLIKKGGEKFSKAKEPKTQQPSSRKRRSKGK